MKDNTHLFTLRLNTSKGFVVVNAFETIDCPTTTHNHIDIEVRMKGEIVFPRGMLYCGLTPRYSIDGKHARELVLSTVAMRPGDTDDEYFADYTPAQLDFANALGEEIRIIREYRYCDPETGEVK